MQFIPVKHFPKWKVYAFLLDKQIIDFFLQLGNTISFIRLHFFIVLYSLIWSGQAFEVNVGTTWKIVLGPLQFKGVQRNLILSSTLAQSYHTFSLTWTVHHLMWTITSLPVTLVLYVLRSPHYSLFVIFFHEFIKENLGTG